MVMQPWGLISFRCPKCNCAEWGSTGAPGGRLTRHCHGSVYDRSADGWRGCSFTWPESDDWKHFVSSFPDRDSYERASAQQRPGPVVAAAPVPLVWRKDGLCSVCGRKGSGHEPGCPMDPVAGGDL